MAIAFDAQSDRQASTSSATLTFSQTCTGSNLMLIVGTWIQNTTDNLSSVTYNGTAMNLVAKVQNPNTNFWVYMHYLANPSTGAHNVVITSSQSETVIVGAATSYTGVLKTTPDNFTTDTQLNVSPCTTSETVIDANSWQVMWANAGSRSLTAGTGTTIRVTNNAFAQAMFDSNGALTAGSHSLVATPTGGTDNFGNVIASLSPTAPASISNPHMLSSTGVGA